VIYLQYGNIKFISVIAFSLCPLMTCTKRQYKKANIVIMTQ